MELDQVQDPSDCVLKENQWELSEWGSCQPRQGEMVT